MQWFWRISIRIMWVVLEDFDGDNVVILEDFDGEDDGDIGGDIVGGSGGFYMGIMWEILEDVDGDNEWGYRRRGDNVGGCTGRGERGRKIGLR